MTKLMGVPELGNQQTPQEQVGKQSLAVMDDDGDEVAAAVFRITSVTQAVGLRCWAQIRCTWRSP